MSSEIFGVNKVNLLGYTMSHEGVKVDSERVLDVKIIPFPTNKEMKYFLEIKTLNKLMKKYVKFEWGCPMN